MITEENKRHLDEALLLIRELDDVRNRGMEYLFDHLDDAHKLSGKIMEIFESELKSATEYATLLDSQRGLGDKK